MGVRRGRRTAWALAGALAVSGALTACQQDEPTTPTTVQVTETPEPSPSRTVRPGVERVLMLHFRRGDDGGLDVSNSWDARVKVATATWGDGDVRAVKSQFGRAAAFPSFARKDAGYAVLSVTNAGVRDALSPGESDFAFGADVYMDKETTGSPADNGDNVLQRGLFEGAAQYKLQVDGGRPSCRVVGLKGDVIVKMDKKLAPESWYRIRCTRRPTYLRLEVTLLTENGPVDWTPVTRQGLTGAVVLPRHTALAIGGKLAEDGTVIPSSTDQFNGRLDRVFLRRYE